MKAKEVRYNPTGIGIMGYYYGNVCQTIIRSFEQVMRLIYSMLDCITKELKLF